MDTQLLDLIRKADKLPSLPTVAVEVLRLTKTEDVSVENLAKVIQNDPALTAAMLKVVNSALFALPRKITSIKQAMVVMGLRTVKVMVLSISLVNALKKSESKKDKFDFPIFWRRSLSSAVAARLLSKTVAPKLMEDAFVGGLLADLGMVAAWRCIPERYEPVLNAWAEQKQSNLTEIETEKLGLTHATMSRELLGTWGLPQTLCEAVGAHHGEGLEKLSGPSAELGKIVHCAALIAALFCQDIPPGELQNVRDCCKAETGIDEPSLESLLAALSTHVRETAGLLSVHIGADTDYEKIRDEAVMQLANLSLEAEAERAELLRREQQTRREMSQMQEEKRAILQKAATDGLTQVANRAAFDERLKEELDRAKVNGHALGLILLDVDHFKRVNDMYGHRCGDEVLRSIAARLREIGGRAGFVARYGGEEFAVIVAKETTDQLRALADEIRQAIQAQPVQHADHKLQVTASLGAAHLEPRSSRAATTAQLIEEADRYLYRAKQNGRNRVETWSAEIDNAGHSDTGRHKSSSPG